MKYFVNIEETINGVFEVEANSKEEALKIAKAKYENCEFVNEPGDLTCVKASIMTNDGKFGEWEEI